MDLAIREFQMKLVELINNAQLPIEVKRLVVEDVARKVSVASEQAIEEQLNERQSEKSEEKEND